MSPHVFSGINRSTALSRGAAEDSVAALCFVVRPAHSPPREEGCLRHQEISAKPTLAPQTGWSLTSHVSAQATTPAASRPPLLTRRGIAPVLQLLPTTPP